MVEVIGKVKLELSFIWPKNTTVLWWIVFLKLCSSSLWLVSTHIEFIYLKNRPCAVTVIFLFLTSIIYIHLAVCVSESSFHGDDWSRFIFTDLIINSYRTRYGWTVWTVYVEERKRKSELINHWCLVYFPDCSLLKLKPWSRDGTTEPENSDYLTFRTFLHLNEDIRNLT